MSKIQHTILVLISIVSSFQCLAFYEGGAKFTAQLNYTKPPDSLIVKTFTKNWTYSDYPVSYFKAYQKGKFRFELEEFKKPVMIMITIKQGNKRLSYSYFMEHTDNVNFEVFRNNQRDSIAFSGNGSEKYNLVNQLEDEFKEYFSERSKLKLTITENLESALEKYAQMVQDYNGRKQEHIEKSNLSPEMKELINLQFANYYGDWSWLLSNLFVFKKTSQEVRDQIRASYLKFSPIFTQLPTAGSINCHRYIGALFDRVRADRLMGNNVGSIPLEQYYHAITNQYSGPVRERLLAEFFMSNYTLQNITSSASLSFDSLVADARRYLGKSELLSEALDYRSRLKRGNKLTEPTFTDLLGNPFNLETLTGKVLLIKVWATGCGGCMDFERRLIQDISPSFEGEQQFKVVSINVDKRTENWINSLNTGKYSTRRHLNLNTGGQGLSHPFLKQLNVNALPFVLIVDKKGNIYQKLDLSIENNDIIKVISSAIKE
ncbi:TlpA family protein disulfide reductase [Pedobacter insulae]|uniref:Thiol-disulfide isomerase or thioredoxin n=1 Tax=Pedobacter insulae TaxID=414048 RepID=A0A1I2ZJB8_9SPHI|nr:TlpA disulfide reductase family protein [Pedobacter insulae]SFH37676.1 Thiol-disulfide isomerase or thioredoxin [Pedobacter insulae]